MGKFLDSEKPLQTEFKKASTYFSKPARADGFYKDHKYSFCLPLEHAEENLFPAIRESAQEFFSRHNIKWHDGHDGKPSNHMCDSQVCCVNFLFPLADQPDGLANILRRVFPNLKCMLPIEDGKYVSFEWIGAENYLGEKISRSGNRTRGANFTSADAIVFFEDDNGRKQLNLIEWKYTESYTGNNLKFAASGTDRTAIYRHLFDAEDNPIDQSLLPDFRDLFYEPFYQFMRQQFLANEMEKAHELGADIVTLLHISPAHNLDFRRITSPKLAHLSKSATGAWNRLVKPKNRFIPVYSEDLFGNLNDLSSQEMQQWKTYIYTRYSWVNEVLPVTVDRT
jgi:hypothetical protein